MKLLAALLLALPIAAHAYTLSDDPWSGHTSHSGPYTTGQYSDQSGAALSTYSYRSGSSDYSQSTYTGSDGVSHTQHCTTHIISGFVEHTCY
jgi:hypothetical protein